MQINKNDYKFVVSAAGRVNIIGEHIDYCGGMVLPAALSVKNTVYIRPNGTDKINLSWTTLPDQVTLDINDLMAAKSYKYGNYQAGALLYWSLKGHKIIGCDMIHDCTVPFGSGLSSSAAIEVSTIAAMCAITNEEINPVEIALAAQTAEREFTGVNCGIMDQYASACGKVNHAMLLNCKTLECEYIPIALGEYSLVIINSKKPHSLVESKYNERRSETEEAFDILSKHVNISCLCELTAEDLETHKGLLRPIVYNRALHVVNETQRVKDAITSMKNNDIVGLGALLTQSHNSLKDLYEVTGIELDTLALIAQNHPACLGSRMVGGGFGGCTVSIVKSSEVKEFTKTVCHEYYEKIGYKAEAYDVAISNGIQIYKI